MPEYTYKCNLCNREVTLTYHEESGFKHLHKLENAPQLLDGEAIFYCDGNFERIYTPPNIIIKGKH